MKHFLLLVLLIPGFCFAQGDQTIINVPIDNYGNTEPALLHLPNDYGQTTTKYPILVFLHGIGEGGTNPASIYNSSSAGGPAYYIAHGQWPASFVNPADNQSYKFIVVSPQSNSGWSTSASQLEVILTYLFNTYRADPARLYLSGISAGGEGVVEYMGGQMEGGVPVNGTHKVAAVLPMSAVMDASMMSQMASSAAQSNIRYWGFGSPSDIHGENTDDLAGMINKDKSNLAISTSYSGGHCCWGQFYTPGFTQNGINIYQWALQYTQGNPAPPSAPTAPAAPTPPTAPPPPPPTAPSGGGFAVPGMVQAESWTNMSGVATQPTSDVGGGLNVGWIDLGDWMKYQVNVSTAGSYTVSFRVATIYDDASFELVDAYGNVLCNVTAPNTGGFQNWQTVTATVNLPAGSQTLTLESTSWDIWNINWMEFDNGSAVSQDGSQPIPGMISAATYQDKTGNIATQPTSDAGGGSNVGWIDNGTYMDYFVNVASTGAYTLSLRVATPYSDASLQVLNQNGQALTSVTLPNTGGFQNWQTFTTTLNLKAGEQTIRVQSTSWDIWNINWMQFTKGVNTSSAATAASMLKGTAVSMDDSVAASPTGTLIWPNPVKDLFTIQLNDNTSGDMVVQVVDVSGTVRQATNFTKTPGVNQVTVNASGLSTGVYFVRILTKNRQQVQKIFKL